VGSGERVGDRDVVVVRDELRGLDVRIGKRAGQLREECLEAGAAGSLPGSGIVVERVLRKALDGRLDVAGVDVLGEVLLSGDVRVFGHACSL